KAIQSKSCLDVKSLQEWLKS
ncbi:hypothetical protein ACVQ1K_001805, partial [Campylobacter jejuni]